VCLGFAGSVACQVQPKLFSTPEYGVGSAVQLKVFPNYHQTVAYKGDFDQSADLSEMDSDALRQWAQRAQERLTGASEETEPRQIVTWSHSVGSTADAGQHMVSQSDGHAFCGGSFMSELVVLGKQVIDTPSRTNHLLPNGVNFIVLSWPIKMGGPENLL